MSLLDGSGLSGKRGKQKPSAVSMFWEINGFIPGMKCPGDLSEVSALCVGHGAAVPRAQNSPGYKPWDRDCSALLVLGAAPLSQFPSQSLILGCRRCLSEKSFICTL